MLKELTILVALVLFACAATATLLTTLPKAAIAVLIVLLVVGLIYVIFFRPKYRYFRLGAIVSSSWITARGIPNFTGLVEFADSPAFFCLEGSFGSVFDICAAALVAFLCLLDAITNQGSFLKSIFKGLRSVVFLQNQKTDSGGMAAMVSTGDNSPVNVTLNNNVPVDFNAEIDNAAAFNKRDLPRVAIEKLNEVKSRY